jgi:curli biogenesis system outer membrane secretion channel CsgG
MNIRGATALGCGVLLLTLTSCGSSKAVTTVAPAAAPATTQPAAAPPAPAAAVPEIYNFKTNKVGGGAVDGAEFAGKPTAFWFWAPT